MSPWARKETWVDWIGRVAAALGMGVKYAELPAEFSGHLDARTFNGRVHSEIAILAEEGLRAHLVGQIRSGGTAMVRLQTANGGIHLRT